MQEKLHARLEELQQEYKKGQERLTALEQETATVRSSMLRISGAIQVLQELLENQKTVEEPEPKLMENGQQ